LIGAFKRRVTKFNLYSPTTSMFFCRAMACGVARCACCLSLNSSAPIMGVKLTGSCG
jgi:hypothetical protein